MAYTKSNEIQTRISLKYDSYENWSSKNPILLAGEVAIATIEKPKSGAAHSTGFQNLPNVVMKVGDGVSNYNDLKFVSGLAADVYDWAKAANKPSYGIGEIVGALEYSLVATDAANYKYELKSRKAGSNEKWAKVSDLDLSGLASRLATAEGKIKTVEDDLNTATTGLKDRLTAAENAIKNINNTGIGGAITAAIEGLDATEEQVAGADGLALKVVQVDGVITEISGSIAAETYDAYGAAAGVKSELLNGEIKANAEAIKKINGNDTGSSMREVANSIVSSLGATVEHANAGDGLTLSVTQANGVITAVSGAIAANTYDAHGAAKAVQGETTKTVKEAWERADAAYELADAAQTADEVSSAINTRVETLSFAGVEGAQEGTTIKFVDKISQANGIVSAELGELVFNSAYDAVNNKAATMADITGAVADLNGAMHFEGVYDDMPSVNHDGEAFKAGDVIIVGKTEYVFSNGEFVELGDEGAIAAALATLSQTEVGAADKTLKVKQENGKVTATEVDIQIAKSQVTGLETDLENLGKEDARLAGLIGDNATAIGKINGSDAGKSMRAVAQEEALKAVDIDVADVAGGADYTMTNVGQTDGAIHATPVKIQIAQGQVTGLPDALNSKLEASVYNTFKANEFNPVKSDVQILVGSGKGSVSDSISTAVSNLKNTDAAVDGQYVKAVKQSNGIVTVERAALPVLAITHATSAEEPADAEVTVVKDIDHNGFTITDTHVKVATSAGVAAAIAALKTDKVAAEKSVITGIHQENGVIKSVDEAQMADIAFSGNVADLKQTANTYVVFNCGTADLDNYSRA